MKVAVLPDLAMIITHLVTKNGHEVLSATNMSEDKLRDRDPYADEAFDRDEPPFNMKGHEVMAGNKYASCETPSGLRGRLSLFDNIIQNSEAAIILGPPPRNYKHMYDNLNELILFSCIGCANQYKLVVKLLKQNNIPILELAYPTNRDEIISLINRVNDFLQKLGTDEIKPGIINDDKLTVELRPSNKKITPYEFRNIVNEVEQEERFNKENK